MEKRRLDVILVEDFDFKSREQAKRTIMAGLVKVDGHIVDKAGTIIKDDANVEVKEKDCPYVSRGGFKIEKGYNSFKIDLHEAICCDMGASTGGFTDFMLKNGASKVYSIDVGYGQLDYSLRQDPRVINLEKTNIRYLDMNLIKDDIDFISMDLSFISLNLILPIAKKMLKYDGKILSLIKPQFEAGREEVGKNGIIKDKKVQVSTIKKVLEFAHSIGLETEGLTFSPIKGAKGNIEFLALFRNSQEKSHFLIKENIESVVDLAHLELV